MDATPLGGQRNLSQLSKHMALAQWLISEVRLHGIETTIDGSRLGDLLENELAEIRRVLEISESRLVDYNKGIRGEKLRASAAGRSLHGLGSAARKAFHVLSPSRWLPNRRREEDALDGVQWPSVRGTTLYGEELPGSDGMPEGGSCGDERGVSAAQDLARELPGFLPDPQPMPQMRPAYSRHRRPEAVLRDGVPPGKPPEAPLPE